MKLERIKIFINNPKKCILSISVAIIRLCCDIMFFSQQQRKSDKHEKNIIKSTGWICWGVLFQICV